MNIGERFDFALKELNITNKEIAESFNISSQNVSNLKKNDRLNDLISQIATKYNINLNWLVTGKGHYSVESNTSQHIVNITENAISKLIKYYSLANASQLANKLEITQGVISNWKSRNAIGALTDTVANKDPKALEFIFTDNSKFSNNVNEIKINDTLLEQAKNEASKFGLDINSYIEHLIIQDLKK
ncbi:helix-turn-helix domain containing protein [Aliarcobacter butzleri]|uniref:helix-turn-helix domain-containing protein n=1 Tax=Aliarcobacter butzleri TaxID=28197 RepID=UPI001EDC2827|nr:helix-turn-helix domain-containing protein [Aliarcobacter butzleri]MCG3668605.1 helix-turn-helix domain containing protein [Aliarcobacter butzleri]